MNVETSFLRDRPATHDEIQELSFETPYLQGPGRYKDLFSVDAGQFEGIPTLDEFYESLERWTFRLN